MLILGSTGNSRCPREGAGGGRPNAANRVGARSVCCTSWPVNMLSIPARPAPRYAKNAAVRSALLSPP